MKQIILLLATAFLLSGCMTLTVNITSNSPEGAQPSDIKVDITQEDNSSDDSKAVEPLVNAATKIVEFRP